MRPDAERNRARILEVARELIASDGPSVSMDAIATQAGVAVGTLYRHHPTKAALVEAVVMDLVDRIADAVEESLVRLEGGADPGHEVDEVFRLVAMTSSVDHAVKAAARQLGARVPDVESAADPSALPEGNAEQRAFTAIGRLLAAAQDAGEIREDLTVGDLLLFVDAVPGADAPPGSQDRYLEVVLAGIRPAPPR